MSDLEKLVWTNELSLNNEDIDREHKKLIEIYNELIDLCELNHNREEFARILTEMTDYGLIHFRKKKNICRNFLILN